MEQLQINFWPFAPRTRACHKRGRSSLFRRIFNATLHGAKLFGFHFVGAVVATSSPVAGVYV
jgi:hypothetical protein